MGAKKTYLIKTVNLGTRENPVRLAVEEYLKIKGNEFSELVKNLLGAYFMDKNKEMTLKILEFKKEKALKVLHKNGAEVRKINDLIDSIRKKGAQNEKI